MEQNAPLLRCDGVGWSKRPWKEKSTGVYSTPGTGKENVLRKTRKNPMVPIGGKQVL